MKTFLLSILIVFSLSLAAQQLNNNGLYVTAGGDIYTGQFTTTDKGIICKYNIVKGMLNGKAEYYYQGGALLETGSFSNGLKDDKWVRYTESGKITAIAFYSLGKKSGTWFVYDEQGTKRFELSYQNGEKSGVWKSWDSTGALVNTVDYTKVY